MSTTQKNTLQTAINGFQSKLNSLRETNKINDIIFYNRLKEIANHVLYLYNQIADVDALNVTPISDTDVLDITGTNLVSAACVDANLPAMTSGTVIDIDLTTSDIEGNASIIDILDSRNHDDGDTDTYQALNVAMSGNFPGTNASVTKLVNIDYSGTLGASGVSGELYGIYSNLSGTLTAGTYAAGYFTEGTNTVTICDGTNALTVTGTINGAAVSSATVDLIPDSNEDAIDITGTNMTTASILDADLSAIVSGQTIDITLDTSDIEADSDIIRIVDSRNHDDGAADAYRGLTIEASGNYPGAAASNAYLVNAEYTGTINNSSILYAVRGDLSGATLTGGTYAGGYFSDGTNTVTLADGTNAITTSQTVSAGTLTDGTVSITAGAGTGLVSLTDGTASWTGSNLSGFGSIGCGTIDSTPGSDITAIDIDGTNVQAGHIIDFSSPALTTGSILNIAAITTKTSGYLYNGSMTTSTLNASTLLDDFSVSCAHDDGAGDTLRGIRRTWSGDIPGSNAADLVVMEAIYSGTIGASGSAANAYAIKGDISGATVTAGTVASGYFTDGTQTVALADNSNAATFTGNVKSGETVGDGLASPFYNIKTIKYQVADPTNTAGDYQASSDANKNEQVFQLGAGAIIPGLCQVLNVVVHASEGWTGSAGAETGMNTDVGTTSSGTEYLTAASVDGLNDVASIAANGAFNVAVSASASSVYVSLTPTVNDWDEFTDGITDIYVTYVDNTMVS